MITQDMTDMIEMGLWEKRDDRLEEGIEGESCYENGR